MTRILSLLNQIFAHRGTVWHSEQSSSHLQLKQLIIGHQHQYAVIKRR